MSVRKWRERGEGQMGCLFGLVLLLIGILIAYKMIPVKVKNAELRDVITDESRAAGQHRDDRIRETIVAKAAQLQLPIKPDDVKIVRIANSITIDVNYTVPVEFPGYTYQWDFHHHTENPIF